MLSLVALGLTATCNSGGAGKWKEDFGKHLSGRDVIILPDNDDPGRKHAEQVAKSAHKHGAKSIKVIELPGLLPKCDVSDWIAGGGTREELEKLVDAAPLWDSTTQPQEPSDDDLECSPSPTDPFLLAPLCLNKMPAIKFYRSEFYIWNGCKYMVCDNTELRATVSSHVENYLNDIFVYQVINWKASGVSDNPPKKLKATRSIINDAVGAIESLTIVPSVKALPCWLGEGSAPTFISLENGLLDIEGLLRGETEVIRDLTADWLTTITLPYRYDPDIDCPKWTAFLNRNLEGDAQRINMIQESGLSPDSN